MSSKVDFPKDPNSPDSIQILIDVFEETRDHHHQQQQQQSSAHQSKQQLSKLKQQQQKQHQNSTAASGKTPTDASGGNGYLGVQENFKRERRNSWCTSRPSETLANLKRKWFAGLTGNGNVKALTGDDNDATEPDKSKSHSLTSLDGEGSISEDEKLSTNQKDTTEFLDRPSSSTLCSSPVPGYRGDDRFLGDDLFSGRNARSEQDVRGHEEKVIEDKLIEVPNLPQLMGERFSLESDNLFAVKTKKMASSASTDVQASSSQEGGKRCTSPTPLRGCPDKVNRSDHPNLDLLVARHKSEGSLQRYPFKELKLSSTAQRKSSVLSKINSYRNSKKNNKAPPVETHNFVSISSSLSSSSTVSHFSAISPSSVCEVCNKPFTNKKIPLKCLDCGLLTHQDNSCKEQAITYTCSADEPRTISNAAKSEEVSDPNVKLNKGNSSATTTESDSLDLPDLSLDETDAVFVSPCPPGSSTTGTGSNTTGTCSTTGIPTVIGGNDDEEAWSLTVDEHVINSMSQSEIKRQNLIWELIRNEKHHYRILKMMLKIFVSGLKTEVGLDSAMVNQLFPGLDGLIVVHGHILKALLKQQSIRQDRRVDDLSSVLLEQFGGSNGHQMEVLYGEFCSQHERAINLYKELRRCDRKFQSFINKCVGIVACERRGIDSCILTVTQRLTKYPLLVDQILKYTEDEKESKGLSDFLHLVRSIISAVNDRVDFVAKKERFEEIFDKLDPKSTTTLGSRTIKKVDILAMEKYLRFHGWIKLKTARGRTVDSLVVVLSDWVVMLSENNHKYYFCNIDNKSSMIPLSQLLVREKDDKHEGRNFFLISSNRDAPAEMYELVCKSNSELKYWTSVLRQATALCASKTGTPLDLMSLVKSDQTQLISLIETMQTRDEEVKTSLNQKLSAVEEFYKTLDKLLPSSNMSDAIKQMALAKRQHLSPEDLVLSVHGQETNLIASLQCGAVSDPARRSLSKDRESSSLESLNSRRTSTASLFSKVSHSSSFRNIADPSLSSSTDPSLHHSSSDGVDCDGMEQVETAKVKRKTSDASVVDTKYSARATMGMLPGFLSIFCKEKDDSQDADELHKHRKQSSLTLQQQSFNNSFQQQQQHQPQPQQLPVQTVSQQQSNLQHTAQQSNKISTSNVSEQQQQTVNNYSSENYSIHKQNLSSEAEERLCNFLNSVHNLSAMVLEMSTEAKKKEVQIICMTRQLEKLEKQSYPMDQQMEELRSVQNQVQLEKFQLQELRSKHQEEVDKLNEDLKQQNAIFELQRAEIKSQKDELQRQRDALQRQIDLFEEHKSSFSVRQQQQQQHQQQQQLSKDQQDENGSLKSLKRHERNHSNPFSLAGKPLSAIIADSAHSSRSGSPCRNPPTFSQHQGSLNSTMTRPQQQQQQQQNNKQVRVGLTSELFEPPVDEKNGVLVTKKDAVPLLPVHLVSAKNESKLDRHTSAIVADDSAQQLTQLGPVKQMFPAKLATTPTSNQPKQKQQTTIATTTNNNSNKITSKQSVVSKTDDKRQSEVEASKPTPSMFFHNRSENHTITGSTLPLHLAEKTRILPSSSSSLQHCHFNNNTCNNKSSSSSNSLEDENRQQLPSNSSNSCSNGNTNNPKTGRSLFGTTKKLSQLLSPSSSSSPPPPPPQSALEAMMTSALLSPRVQFLSFPNFSGQITPSSPPLPSSSSSSTPPLQSSSSSSLPSSSTVTNSFKSKTTTTRTSTVKTTTKAAAGGSDDDEIIFI